MISSVIPVAGLGTRSLPASKAIPKEMLPVFDRPIIQYIIEEAVSSGAGDIIFVTSKGKKAIENHFSIDSDLEKTLLESGKKKLYDEVHRISRLIDYKTVPQEEARGLGHAVLMAKDLVPSSPFGVLLGDDMMVSDPPGLKQLIDFYHAHDLSKNDAGVIMLMEVPESDVSKYGICEMDPNDKNRVVRCVEKPKPVETSSRFAIMGRYLLPKYIFELLESQKTGALGEIQLTDALNSLAEEGRLYGCVLKGARFDAGDRLGYLRANIHYYMKAGYSDEVRKMFGEIFGK